MKFSLECDVDSRINIPKILSRKIGKKEFIFNHNKDMLLNKIKIIVTVDNPDKFYSKIEKNATGKADWNFTINRDKEIYDELIEDFKQLESQLAFCGSLKKIMWHSPKEEIICETEEEKQSVNIFGSNFKQEYPDPIQHLDEKSFTDIIETKDKYSLLTIPKAFWREGNNDFKRFRYINAFFNFYYILEGLYGNGKSKNSAIEKEFINSSEFCEFVNWFLESLKKETRHLKKINEFLKLRNKKLDTEGIIHLLVSTRGDLHHFTNNPNKKQNMPFNDKEFESISWMTLGLATRAILQKILEINLQCMKK